MANFSSLPNELLDIVLHLVSYSVPVRGYANTSQVSPLSLLALHHTSHRFRILADPFIHRTIDIDYSSRSRSLSTQCVIRRLTDPQDPLRFFVKELRILNLEFTGRKGYKPEVLKAVSHVQKLASFK